MSKYRIGEYWSVAFGDYAIQKKVWYGWRTIATFDFEEDAIEYAEELEEEGHEVIWCL